MLGMLKNINLDRGSEVLRINSCQEKDVLRLIKDSA